MTVATSVPSARRRPSPLRAVVTRQRQLSPRLVRVSVTGDAFDRFNPPGPAAHFKLMLPQPGADDVQLPPPDAEGNVVFGGPAMSHMPTMRTYTARRFDPATLELDIDIVLHGVGPAAAWAAGVRPGDRLAVSIPSAAGFTDDPAADWVLLAGDASALPAIASIASKLTKPATVQLEVADSSERIDIGVPVEWITSQDVSRGLGSVLEQHVARFVPPAGRGQVWVATEAGAVRRIRAELLQRFDRTQITTRGYWRAGQPNHPDHDYGDGA